MPKQVSIRTRRAGRVALAGLALLLLALVLAHPSLAAMRAEVEARQEAGFGRLAFTFPSGPKVTTSLKSGILLVLFGEPVTLRAEDLAERLPDYFSSARLDADGKTLRLALNRSYRVNTIEAGNRLFLDLLPPEWKDAPPPPPDDVVRELAEQAARAEAELREAKRQMQEAKPAPRLTLRVGEQPTFTRLTFDWSAFATAKLSRDGNAVTIGFDRKAEIDLSRLKTDPPRFLQSASDRAGPESLEVTLVVADGVEVRDFREGLAYVVDLTGPPASEGAAPEQAAAPAPNAGPAEPPPAPLPSDPGSIGMVFKPFDPAMGAAAFGDVGFKPGDPLAGVAAKLSEVTVKPAKAASAKPAPAASDHDRPATGGDAKRRVAARAERVAGQLRLTFPFAEPVSAAAFRRGHAIWLVFDSDAEIALDRLEWTGAPWIKSVSRGRFGMMQYFRIDLSKTWLASAEASGEDWVVTIGDMVGGTGETLALVPQQQDDRRSVVTVALPNPGRVHWLPDPEVGDTLAVVTAFPPNRSVGKIQDFVDFTALETAHGLAIRPRSDDLGVRIAGDQVTISRAPGLTLSTGGPAKAPRSGKPLVSNQAFAAFREAPEAGQAAFGERAAALMRDIAQEDAGQKNARRLALAQLYLGQGLGAEAIGLLGQIGASDATAAHDPALSALRGAASVLMGRPTDAIAELDGYPLAADPDVALWRGLALAQRKEPEKALAAFKQGAAVAGRYRPEFEARFRLAAARAALDLQQPDRAADELAALNDKSLPQGLAAEAVLLDARYLDRAGRAVDALEQYRAARAMGVPGVAAEAELAQIEIELRTQAIERRRAIEQLERLRLVWRGDDVELAVMGVLADLYVKESQYRSAFGLMKEAALAFPTAPRALQLQDRMQATFQDPYLGGKADKLATLDALSLYYEFREMTPVGPLGDEMIRGLADRLIAFDLLDQAMQLLEHQVEKRLKGAARAQVATRLAMVQLMNRQPDAALRVIRRTRQAGLPEELQQGRNLLEARALGELGRVEAALELLSDVEGSEADRIRADALWTAQQWKASGEQFEKMLGDRWQAADALSDTDRLDAMRAAISFALADEREAVDRLRRKFSEKMTKTPDAEAFLLVTRNADVEKADFRQAARLIANADTLDAFMKAYRARYDRAGAASTASAAGGSG